MIGEVRSGTSFRGLNHYMLHGRSTAPKLPAWVELRNLFEQDPDRAHEEMAATASQNPHVQEPVLHLMVSPAPEDHLSGDDWRDLAERTLRGLGLEEHEALVVLHGDTRNPHLHISVNRVHPRTLRAWDAWRSKTRLEGILRQIEREWGLRPVKGRLAGLGHRAVDQRLAPPLSVGEQAQLKHRAEEPLVLKWRTSLGPHFSEATSWTDLAARLKANGVQLAARGRGLVVTDGARFAKASRIARDYSRGKLEARFGVSFAEWRARLDHWQRAAALHPRYLARSPGDRRLLATTRVLRAAGRRLGWRALYRLQGPFAPAVGSLRLAERLRQHDPSARTPAWDDYVRRYLRPALERSGSWAEAEGRLRRYGAWVAPSPGSGAELVVTDGEHTSVLSRLGPAFRGERLTERFGPWNAWERTRRALYEAAGRYRAAIEQAPDREREWRRLARVIGKAESLIERRDTLRHTLRRASERLRGHLAPYTRGEDPVEVQLLLKRLRGAPDRNELQRELLAIHRQHLYQRLLRSAPTPQLRHEASRYWGAARALRQAEPAARSAARRLAILRRRARLLAEGRPETTAALSVSALARPLLGLGVRSLLARAAPGLTSALGILRFLRDGVRELDRAR